MGCRKKSRKYVKDKDRISKLPTDVTQLILEKLPLVIVARTSVLSKTWKKNWLSLRTLEFNADFWEVQMKNGRLKGEKYCSIITNIFLSHNGPIKKFLLHMPENIEFTTGCLNLSPWLSFLSKNRVENIEIFNRCNKIPVTVTSNIFRCIFLMRLELEFVTVRPPPPDFECFRLLMYISFNKVSFMGDSCQSLISKCPLLRTLFLTNCDGVDDIVLDAPYLDMFAIRGTFETLSLEDIKNVQAACLSSEETEEESIKAKLADPLAILTSSSKFKHLFLERNAIKALTAGGIGSLPLPFIHLSQLTLTKLDLSDVNIFHSTCLTICSCANINFLDIILGSTKPVMPDEFDYDSKDYEYDHKKTILSHLRTVKIAHVVGTIAELKLLQLLLAISTVLEKLIYRYDETFGVDLETEAMMLRELVRFPRASSKAQFVLSEQWLWK